MHLKGLPHLTKSTCHAHPPVSHFALPSDSPQEVTNPQLKRAASVEPQLTWLEWARRPQELPQRCSRAIGRTDSIKSTPGGRERLEGAKGP